MVPSHSDMYRAQQTPPPDGTVVRDIQPSSLSPRHVGAEFRNLITEGMELRPVGAAKRDPLMLLRRGYTPKYRVKLFDATYYLTNTRFDDNIGFFVAYVHLSTRAHKKWLYPRIFYKDVSLVWRSANHHINSDRDNWIAKGDLKTVYRDGVMVRESAEETTNLPLEIQGALDTLSRRAKKARRDNHAVHLILRHAPDNRIAPYRDFAGPRRKAASRPGAPVNGGDYVAYFTEHNNPQTLKFVQGFEPDFRNGLIEITKSGSRVYGGKISKHRIMSKNRQIQYQFVAAPRHVWIVPPQTLTTEIMSYGMRTIDVNADDDVFVPGYEYHYIEDDVDPPQLHTQIPPGYAGEPNRIDPHRADASPWLDKLPVIRQFRRMIARTG